MGWAGIFPLAIGPMVFDFDRSNGQKDKTYLVLSNSSRFSKSDRDFIISSSHNMERKSYGSSGFIPSPNHGSKIISMGIHEEIVESKQSVLPTNSPIKDPSTFVLGDHFMIQWGKSSGLSPDSKEISSLDHEHLHVNRFSPRSHMDNSSEFVSGTPAPGSKYKMIQDLCFYPRDLLLIRLHNISFVL